MKFLFIILFTIINYFTVLGQLKTNILSEENNINLFEYNNINNIINNKDNIKKNLFCIDINYIGISVAYARRIKESKWYIGGGIGMGPSEVFLGDPYSPVSYIGGWNWWSNKVGFSSSHCADMLHLDCFAIKLPSKYFMLETGIRGSVKMIWSIEDSEDRVNIFPLLTCYVKPMFGWRNFMIGPLIEFIPIVPIFLITPLFRFNFKF